MTDKLKYTDMTDEEISAVTDEEIAEMTDEERGRFFTELGKQRIRGFAELARQREIEQQRAAEDALKTMLDRYREHKEGRDPLSGIHYQVFEIMDMFVKLPGFSDWWAGLEQIAQNALLVEMEEHFKVRDNY